MASLTRARMGQALLLVVVGLAAPHGARVPEPTEFARLVAEMSEGPGYFPSDNLVSNETSYLHVIGAMSARGVRGGGYLGVGPEQGFAYIAEIQPAVAFMIDIRRDNLLLHLLLKAMFQRSGSRLEYLCLLYGRDPPPDLTLRTGAEVDELLDYIESAPFDSARHAGSHDELMALVERFGVPLSDTDRATMARFHREFASNGLALRYTNQGRSFRPWFPTARDIYSATDLEGRAAGYLASDERWRRVRTMQLEDRIVPVVGDLAGPRAVRAIAEYLRARRLVVSAFYLSNVESYLFRNGSFGTFAENVRALPVDTTSVLIRSWFGRVPMLPGASPGHLSTQQLHRVDRFLRYVDGGADGPNYWGLVLDAAEENVQTQPPP